MTAQGDKAGLRLADVSEAEVLRRIFPLFGVTPGVLVAPGDDAALLATPSGAVIATTDSMVRDRDWRDDWSSGHDVGVKLVAQNVADVAAMGSRPTGLLVSLMADPQTQVGWVEDFAAGVAAAAADAGCSVIGGDLSSAPPGVVVVSMTALGDLGGRAPVLRSGAQVGDLVAVCGSLGWSGAGLLSYAVPPASAEASPAVAAAPDIAPGSPDPGFDTPEAAQASPAGVEVLRAFHRAPRPPWEAGPLGADAGATAMIDISDGLVRDGGRIAQASGVSLDLSESALRSQFLTPPLTDLLDEETAWRQILGGGEEHSLLATFPLGFVPEGGAGPWRVIGRCVEPGADGPQVTVDGIPAQVSGWDHFHA